MIKRFKRLIFLSACTIFLIQNIYGHEGHSKKPKMPAIGVVQGSVTDSTSGAPIEYASISMIDNHDGDVVTGGLSDKNGSFNISEIPLGEYIVVIEFIGYSKKEIGPINIFPGQMTGGKGKIKHFLGEIPLKVSSVNLDAIEVVGDESQFIQTVDKQVFKVGKNLTAAGGTGFDLLRKVPTVDVNIDGEVSIAGDANVTILIDGKRSGLTGSNRRGVVDNIQVSMVEKVEVITNPSADGFVMTSTFSTMLTWILSTTPRLFEPVSPERFPSIKIVTLASPAIDTSPSIFTSTVGTFLKRSNPVPPAAVRFLPTLNTCLSTVCMN